MYYTEYRYLLSYAVCTPQQIHLVIIIFLYIIYTVYFIYYCAVDKYKRWNMRKAELERVSSDLLSILPIIFRSVRKKVTNARIADFEVEITPLHFEVLRLLDEQGTLHASEIGARLQIARAQITQIIDKLVTLKIIKRSTATLDRRTINISLTGRGSFFLKKHESILLDSFRESMSGLTNAELKELSESLGKIRDILVKLK